MGLISAIRGLINMLINDTSKIEKTFNVKLAQGEDMRELIATWESIYQGHAPWVGAGKDEVDSSLNVATIICSDLACKAVSEIAINQGSRSDKLFEAFVDNNIHDDIRQQVEYGLAMGAMIARPYFNPETNSINIQWVTADKFIPVKFDGKKCIAGIFIEQIEEHSNGITTYFTKLELQDWVYGKDGVGGSVHISVKAFKSNTPDTLTTEISLTERPEWETIQPDAYVDNLEAPLFAYQQMPFANNKTLNNRGGVSIYKDAIAPLEEIDRCYSSIKWEREYTEGKVFVNESMLPSAPDANGMMRPKLNSKDKRLFKTLDGESGNDLLTPYAPAIRQADLIALLKHSLSLVCLSCRVDASAYVFDEGLQAVTATEIKSRNQKTYQTLCDVQQMSVVPFLKKLVKATSQLQKLYGVPAFKSNDIDVSFGDSILTDTETEKKNAQAEVSLSLRSKLNYLMEIRGLTEEEAQEELDRINEDAKANIPAEVDFFGDDTEGDKSGDGKEKEEEKDKE